MAHLKIVKPLKVIEPPKPKPPKDLDPLERDTWLALQDEFEVTDGPGVILLTLMARALMTARRAREAIAAEGMTVGGKPHPLLKTVHESERAAQAAMRALRFDAAPVRPGPGRPAGTLNRR